MARRRHPATIASERQHKEAAAGRMTREEAFHEVHAKTPSIVRQTIRKKGKAAGERQRTAIALSKAGLSRRKK